MKFTLSWLKDHLETDATLEQITETLTMIGLEVEGVDDRASLKPFTIAKVISAEQHPDADRLKVLMVDTGAGEPVQVVCGAPNACEGLVGAFAAPGTYVPGIDVTLSVGKIRGVESHGMMCSERELEMSNEHDGIIDLPADTPIGGSFAVWAGLDDPVIEIGLTPNRPDCTGVYGIARDLAAAGLGNLKSQPVPSVSGKGACPVNVRFDFGDRDSLCPAFALRQVSGVKNGPSPGWLQQRLRAIGLRPINILVDITNYVTFDRGRPLHVFDAAKVRGDLVVRRAHVGETLLGLDGKEHTFDGEMCVISDDNGVESIGGIMGGEHSGCDEATTDVLIESALWVPTNIARTGRNLGINTDARYRFERGVDPDFMVPGAELATQMVLELAGGQAGELQVLGEVPTVTKSVAFPVSEVERLTGIELSADEISGLLSRLGFENDGADPVMKVTVPSWRPDIDGKADLVEEVMRLYGVNNIEPTPLPALQSVGSRILTTLQIRTRSARRGLAVRGMMEAVNWSFIPHDQAVLFGGGSAPCQLANPIAEDMSDMRPSLLPGLLAAAARNHARGFGDVALFEVSDIYHSDTPEGQSRAASGIRRGGDGRDWRAHNSSVDVFDAKADAFAVLEACGAPIDRLQVSDTAPDWFHPFRSGVITLGPKTVLGHFGEFHPEALRQMGVKGPLCGFEIFLEAIPAPRAKPTRTKPRLDLFPLQALQRDFAFVVDDSLEASKLLRAALGSDKKLITDAHIFDVYQGKGIEEGKKSLALEVTIQPHDKTLTDEELEALSAKLIAAVEKATGGVLRA